MDFPKYFVIITIVISIFSIPFRASMIATSSTSAGLLMNDSGIDIITPEMTVYLRVSHQYGAPSFMEGSDVYFECGATGNTKVIQFEWYHNYKKLHPYETSKSNSTLVLQSISKASEGKYFCKATDVRGSLTSNEIYLDVKYAPICKHESSVIFAAINQVINLICLVDSNPSHTLDFKWKLNNSPGNGVELPILLKQLSTTGKDGSIFVNPILIENYILSKNSTGSNMIGQMGSLEERLSLYEQKGDIRTSGKLTLSNVYPYNIESREDFGIVSCVASNQWGHSQPCWYCIIPDPVENCIAYNTTSYSIKIKCITGYDGDIHQQFNVQVYDELYQQFIYNMTYEHSQFEIKNLPSDSVFVLRITSINLRGPSKQLTVRTLSANWCLSEVLLRFNEPVFILLGLLGVVNILGIGIAIFLLYRKHIRQLNGSAIAIADKKNEDSLGYSVNTDRRPLENSAEEFRTQEETINHFRRDFSSVLQPTFGQPRQFPIAPQHKDVASVTTNPITKTCNTPTDFKTRSFATTSFDSLKYSRLKKNIAEEFRTQEETINRFRKDFSSVLQPTFGQPRQLPIAPQHKDVASVTTNPITKTCNTPTDFKTQSFATTSFDSLKYSRLKDENAVRIQLENVDDSPEYLSMKSFKPSYSTIQRKNKSEMSLPSNSPNKKTSVSLETLKSVCTTESP